MTEAEWLVCNDVDSMLNHLQAKRMNRSQSGRRKLRLFGCACCRTIGLLMSNDLGRNCLALGERLADNPLDREIRLQAKVLANSGFMMGSDRVDDSPNWAAYAVLDSNVMMASRRPSRIAARLFHREGLAVLLHDIFGNPFRTMTIDRAWLTPDVISLAQAIHDEGAFNRMPILGAALEAVCCDDADILSHCRSKTEHVRGCWLVDALLGR